MSDEIGLVLSLLFSVQLTIITTISTLMTLAMTVHFIRFNMNQTKKFSRQFGNLLKKF
ncbi:hypothetical protein [Streptococcus parasanguinis]|uniref:hypothetical protein n=1 Tax=Streptococcus parasanguinis TaxID=1318 RepID=UPI000A500B4B|nr:hypothetical protein [Streptococcus parasanguinis]MCP9068939.1 hypothetical protein [Streptococcus parasanguinis]